MVRETLKHSLGDVGRISGIKDSNLDSLFLEISFVPGLGGNETCRDQFGERRCGHLNEGYDVDSLITHKKNGGMIRTADEGKEENSQDLTK